MGDKLTKLTFGIGKVLKLVFCEWPFLSHALSVVDILLIFQIGSLASNIWELLLCFR